MAMRLKERDEHVGFLAFEGQVPGGISRTEKKDQGTTVGVRLVMSNPGPQDPIQVDKVIAQSYKIRLHVPLLIA
jgi:hypothetical protein